MKLGERCSGSGLRTRDRSSRSERLMVWHDFKDICLFSHQACGGLHLLAPHSRLVSEMLVGKELSEQRLGGHFRGQSVPFSLHRG